MLTWQSGYPFAVIFARGYPQYGPGEFSAVDVLVREEVDAALILASDPIAHFPSLAASQLKRIPTIVLDPTMNLTAQIAHVFLSYELLRVGAAGTSYRMDNVPIRLRAVLTSACCTDETVLDELIEAIKRC